MLHAPLFELSAHDARKGIGARLGQIGDAEAGGIELIARPHRRDDGNICLPRRRNEVQLGGDVVNAVGDIVVPRERHEMRRLGQVKERMRRDFAFGVDLRDARAHDVRLAFSHRGRERDELAVDVALLDDVFIDEREMSDARPRERFGTKAAHAAQTEHGDAACMKFFDTALP